jgi:ANTAR domain-containing protein/GAF domain-containing protein
MWLATTLVELTDIRHADFDDATYANVLATRLAELLSPAEVGLLMTDGISGGMAIAAASTQRVSRLLSLESRYGDGPCTACYRTGQRVLNEPLTAASHWPRFSAAARAAGFLTASALPMRRRAVAIGAITILNTSDRMTAEPEVGLAQLVAEAATVGILQERALRLSIQASAQLQRALDSRVMIEQAKGVVAARLGIEPGAAFELLRTYARRHNRQLAEVSRDAVQDVLPACDLVVTRRAGPARRR